MKSPRLISPKPVKTLTLPLRLALLLLLTPILHAQPVHAKCQVPGANQVCFDQRKEARRPIGELRSSAPLFVDVQYGRKRVSALLGESQYAPDKVPAMFRSRIASELAATGIFPSVFEVRTGQRLPAGGLKLSITLEPTMRLTDESAAIGVGSAGLYALFGGALTTYFELTMLSELSNSRGRRIGTDRYFLSGMTTSTLYREQDNITGSWHHTLEFVLPHIVNLFVAQWRQLVPAPEIQAPEPPETMRAKSRQGSPPFVDIEQREKTTAGGASAGERKTSIIDIQRRLTLLGYAPGPIDGIMGRRTAAAIRQFQRDSGVTVDGLPSASLLETLKAGIVGRQTPSDAPVTETPASNRSLFEDLETLDDF